MVKLKKIRDKLSLMYWSAVAVISGTMISVQPVMADTIWNRFSTIMKDVYGQIVAISTIVADFSIPLPHSNLRNIHLSLAYSSSNRCSKLSC